MASIYDSDLQLDNDFAYQQYSQPVPPPPTINTGGTVTIINTINGRGGSNVTFSGGTTGLDFGGSGADFVLEGTLVVASGGTGASTAAGARANLGAAKSGANDDITSFSALTGNTGVHPWTGTPDGGSQSTYPATVAAVTYDQTQMQDLMDKMQDVTEFLMFLVTALLAPGVVET
jgi:hypothetical protein